MNLFAFSSILVVISCLSMAIFMFWKGKGKKLNILWGWVCLMAAFWGLGSYKFSTTTSEEIAFFWWQIAHIGAILTPIMYYHFTIAYLKIKKKNLLIIGYSLAIFFLALNLFAKEIFLGDLRIAFNQFYWHDWNKGKSPVYLFFYITFYWVLLFHSFSLLLKQYKNSTHLQRNQLKYFILGSTIGWLGTHGMFPICFGLDIPPFFNFLIAMLPVIIGYAIVRHQLMDIHIVIKKSLVYSALISTITLLYILLIIIAEQLFRGTMGYSSSATSIVIVLIIAIIATPLKNKIQYIIDKTFFKGTNVELAKENELLRKEVAQAEKTKAIATLASGIAHEVKNPLTAIQTFSEYLPKKLDDKEFLLKFSTIVGSEVKRIDYLVNQLLDFAKPSPLELKKTNTNKLIRDTLNFLNSNFIKHKITVETQFANDNETNLTADQNQLKQALLNIFLNAIDSMQNTSGTLTVKTIIVKSPASPNARHSDRSPKGAEKNLNTNNNRPNDAIEGISQKPDCLQITVQDTGKGIAKEDFPRLFDPFFSKKDHGTGLGLAITQGIIQEHNGKIKISSAVNKGTTITIELPLM